jgi:hypothetical protein
MSKRVGFLLSALAWLASHAPVGAQATPLGLSISSRQVASNEHLIVPVELASAERLTLLALDFVYWPADALCSALVDPNAITLRGAGRTAAPSQENYIHCELGRIRVVFFDLIGDTVIPAGTGPIFEIDFGAVRPGASAVINLGLQDIDAHDGPDTAAIANLSPPGMCELQCAPFSDRDWFSCWWQCRACLPDEACHDPATLAIGPGGSPATPDESGRPTSPPTTAAASCPGGATDASVTCRLGQLVAMARGAGIDGGKLLAPLLRAERRVGRAGEFRAAGQRRKLRAFLRRAVGDLRVFRTRLRSRRVGRLVGGSAKTAMLSLAEPLRLDLQALVTTGR